MKHAVVNVATTDHFRVGQKRLAYRLEMMGEPFEYWTWEASGWPLHSDIPYGFKAHALKAVADKGIDLLLWADSCILPIRSLEPLWERIEKDGYWFARNGFSNYEWTADSAYPDLFHDVSCEAAHFWIDGMRAINRTIPHVVATAFGLNVKHPLGKAFLNEYFRLASETRAFCGPWINTNHASAHPRRSERWRYGACGPPDVKGHRHDQSAASVIAWRLGMKLTDVPLIFSYKGGETENTILVADGDFA
jgi:hypothetical protein